MPRYLLLLLLLLMGSWSWPVVGQAQSAAGLPARPVPFRFVTDGAQLLSAADAKTLESGLRRYADNTGTQIVVVTVPTLGGRDVADYGRALGTAWGVGQRDKNNGLVVLLAGQEHKVTIQAGSGLRGVITPAVTARVINEQMTPGFKQGNYFAGLRAGLNTLMLAANPNSNPRNSPSATPDAAASAAAPEAASPAAPVPVAPEPYTPAAAPEPQSSGGLGFGALAVGAALVVGGIWLLMKVLRRRSSPAAPDFYGTQSGGPARGPQPNAPQPQGPDFYGNRGGNYNNGGGSNIGGMLATGAAAAAGAYLGNRMASNSSDDDNASQHLAGHGNSASDLPRAAPDSVSSSGFPFLSNSDSAANDDANVPDYFSGASTSEPDYFSSDDSSYDDTSSDDTGGGGFDGSDDNSGSW